MSKSVKAQGTFEYAIIICIFAAALLASSVYILRSFQGRYRESADVFGQREQYQRGVTKETFTDPASLIIPQQPYNTETCKNIVLRTTNLEQAAAELREVAARMDTEASEIEAGAGMGGIGNNELTRAAQEIRKEAERKRSQATGYENQALQYRTQHPNCF